MIFPKKHIISLGVSIIGFNELLNEVIQMGKNHQKGYACFANSHMTIEAHEDKGFQQIVNSSVYTLADGVPLQKAVKLMHGINQERIAGMDFMPAILKKAEAEKVTVYLYGSTPEILQAIQKRISTELPCLIVGGVFSPPFRQLSETEIRQDIDRINSSGAGIVLVALGCPKQEKWMAENSSKINAILLGVGAAFPIFAQTQRMAPAWMRKNGLEWFYRFMQEPRRLFKRYLSTNFYFSILIIRQWVRIKYLG
ncbi:MAG: WecB/TagA/CpsF family glycosyltransferase [Bacteroidia bacterium]